VLHTEAFASGEWAANCYILHDESLTGIVIDPGEDFELPLGYLKARSLNIQAIVATHAHYDHIASAAYAQEQLGVPFYLHGADARLLKQANFYRKIFGGKRVVAMPAVDFDLADRTALQFGALSIDVLHTPGHTPGSVGFLIDGHLFAGDTILGKRIGRTDLPGGDKDALKASINRILALPPSTVLYPGHGAPATLTECLAQNAEVAEIVG
jgi:glyoxylase-like metal-dependent hydrolase (beta-lactamase superfamily II)